MTDDFTYEDEGGAILALEKVRAIIAEFGSVENCMRLAKMGKRLDGVSFDGGVMPRSKNPQPRGE